MKKEYKQNSLKTIDTNRGKLQQQPGNNKDNGRQNISNKPLRKAGLIVWLS